jgi:hypothetical protein
MGRVRVFKKLLYTLLLPHPKLPDLISFIVYVKLMTA